MDINQSYLSEGRESMKLSTRNSSSEFESSLKGYELLRHAKKWDVSKDIRWELIDDLPAHMQEIGCQLAVSGSYNEEIGLLTAGKLIEKLDDTSGRYALAAQMADEANHSDAFSRYVYAVLGHLPDPSEGSISLLRDLDGIDNTSALFAVHTLLEGLAFDQFTFLQKAFDNTTLGDIYGNVMQDEARHVAMGIDYLKDYMRRDSSEEVKCTEKWCRENILELARVRPELFHDMEELTGESSSDIKERFIRRHNSRLEQIFTLN